MKHAIIIAALWLMASQNAYSQTTNKSDEFLLKESASKASKHVPGAANINNADKISASRLLAKAEPAASTKSPSSMEPAATMKSETPATVNTQNLVAQAPAKTGSSIAHKLQSVRNHTLTMQDATKTMQANTRALLANTDAIRANSEALAANVRAMQANRHLRMDHRAELAAANKLISPAPDATNMRQPAPINPAPPSKTYDKPAASASALVKAPTQPKPAPIAAAPAKAPAPLPAMPKVEKAQLPVAAAPAKAPVAPAMPAPTREVAKVLAPVAPAVATTPTVAKPQAPAAPVAAAPASTPSNLPAPLPMAAVKAPATAPVLMSAAPAKMNKSMGLREKMEISWNGKMALPAPKPSAAIPAPAPKVKSSASSNGPAMRRNNNSMPLNDLMLVLNKAKTTRTTMRTKALMPGDIVTTHGFLRVVSTEDSATEKETYVLQLTFGSQQSDSCFLVKISADELADDNVKETANHAKQFVRQLIKGRVPCTGGHVMRKPVFVTVTGELKYDGVGASAMKGQNPSYRGKRNLRSYTAWEIGQLSNIEFSL
jgi:hypothetical protein